MKSPRSAIDWFAVKERLTQSRSALERASISSRPDMESTFARRASALAARRRSDHDATDAILVFRLGSERYGIALRDLSEVLPLKACAKVPGAPAELVGVISVRGEIRSLLHLGRLLGLGGEYAGAGYVVLVRGRRREVALNVEHVERIAMIALDKLVQFDPASTSSPTPCVLGLTDDGVAVLDASALLQHRLLIDGTHHHIPDEIGVANDADRPASPAHSQARPQQSNFQLKET
jgi:purine-binding chemotaxis protein CheW